MERKMFFDAYPLIFSRACYLRRHMTVAEKLLWEQLRKNKLGLRFKPQHPMQFYIADFYSYALKLIIEIDGPIHDFQRENDKKREAEIIALGNTVIRFTNDEVINNMEGVLNTIKAEISRIQALQADNKHDSDKLSRL